MYNYESVLNGIEDDIKDILFSYIKTESYTSTEKEREAENFFVDYFSSLTYFKENKYSYGKYKIENDSLNRNVFYRYFEDNYKG
jgi:arginine utilization protein RocB